jgi:phospholipid N-methyltransferase
VELLHFLKEYLASPKHVGGLTPSSKHLAELVTETARVREAQSVVEFGPGTGAFTQVITQKLREDAQFIAIEIREDFVKLLDKRFPGVKVFYGSAVDVRKYLAQSGLDHCDCIVSGLPFALFEDALQEDLLDAAVDVLAPGGIFATFTYITSPFLPKGRKFYRRLVRRFSRVDKTRIVWRNFLPAFAYCCVK